MPKKTSASKEQDILHMARLIQSKISREGTRPRWFVRSSLPRLRKILDAQVKKAIRDPG